MTLPAPADPRSVRWRYHFTDFRTGRLISTLPMRDVSLSEVLSGAASGSGTVPLSAQVMARDPFTATLTRRTVCWAERQVLDPRSGLVVEQAVPWAGIVLKRTRAYAGRAMKLDMVTWPGYFARRLIRRDYTPQQTDKFHIMRRLFSDAAAQPFHESGENLYPYTSPHTEPLLVGEEGFPDASGVLADRTYLATDDKVVLSAAQELSNSGDGFDWRIVPYMGTPGDLTTMRIRLDLGYPRLGRTAPADLRWSTDRADARQRWGYVEDLTVVEDGSAVDNRKTATGAGTGEDQIRVTVDSTETARDEEAAGYPTYESSLNSSTSDDRTYDTVRGKAYGALIAGFASEVQVSGIKVRGDLAPTLTSYTLGDDVTIRVGDAIVEQPTTIIGQLIGRTISPAEQGRTETATLDVQGTVVT